MLEKLNLPVTLNSEITPDNTIPSINSKLIKLLNGNAFTWNSIIFIVIPEKLHLHWSFSSVVKPVEAIYSLSSKLIKIPEINVFFFMLYF